MAEQTDPAEKKNPGMPEPSSQNPALSQHAEDADYGAIAAGKTTIAPEVLLNIARLATLNVDGISRMSTITGGVDRFFTRGYNEGVRLEIKEDTVNVDLYVILKHDYNIREVCRLVQQETARAISEMVGMQVGRINVHVEDVDYPAEAEA